MRALITGGVGFVGLHLSRHLADCRDDVAVTYLPNQKGSSELEQRLSLLPKTAQAVSVDVTKKEELAQLIALMQPDVVYHLAAITFVPEAEKSINLVLDVNAFGTKNLIDAIIASSPKTKLVFVSSSEVYGIPRPSSLPLSEVAEMRPISSYGVSKALAEHFIVQACYSSGLDAVIARPFPHVGPYQEERYSLSGFAKQIVEIKRGKRQAVLEVGDLSVKRDFSDVSDIVRGYRDLCLNGRSAEAYNLCRNESYVLLDLVTKMLSLHNVTAEIKEMPERMRTIDIPEHIGSNQKALKDLGWKPRVELDNMLVGLLSYWEENI